MPSADDTQLQKKACHRLIGAVVFVAIAATLLILAMDAEPPDNPAPTLAIPSADGVEILPLDGSLALLQTPLQPEITPPTPEPVPPLTTPAPPPPSPAVVVRTEPSPAAVISDEPSRQASVAAPPPTAAPKPAPAPAPSIAPPPPVANPALQEANRAAAILAGRSPEGTSTSQPATASYVVQVIASGNKDTVRDTVEKLRALKLPVYTETASGNMTRVRVGPYATRSEAERAEVKINQDGKIDGTKIFPQSPS